MTEKLRSKVVITLYDTLGNESGHFVLDETTISPTSKGGFCKQVNNDLHSVLSCALNGGYVTIERRFNV